MGKEGENNFDKFHDDDYEIDPDESLLYFIQQLLKKHFSLKEFYQEANLFDTFDISLKTGTWKISGHRYKIVKLIKTGTYGSVYEAKDGSGEPVAIKLITPQGTWKEKTILFGKARKEIQLLTALKKSANVVTILNAEVKRSSVAIVMELCTTNLHEWMEMNVPEKWPPSKPSNWALNHKKELFF